MSGNVSAWCRVSGVRGWLLVPKGGAVLDCSEFGFTGVCTSFFNYKKFVIILFHREKCVRGHFLVKENRRAIIISSGIMMPGSHLR